MPQIDLAQIYIPQSLTRMIWIIVGAYIFYFIFKKFGGLWLTKILRARCPGEKRVILQKRTKTIYRFLVNTLKTVIFFIVSFLLLDQLGVNIAPFLTGAGIIGVAIGFGSQTLVKDYISGIFIIAEDQFCKGENIEIAKIKGTVKDFTLRKTVLIDENGTMHFIPNSQIVTVSNFSRNIEKKPVKIKVKKISSKKKK
jgi:small conductance mechanosensitive channel